MSSDDSDNVRKIADAINSIGDAITPQAVVPGPDAAGGTVDSLTEAVMGMTAGLVKIANAIEFLAETIRDKE